MKTFNNSCEPGSGCCKVESIISVDERGQMVLPKEIREKAGIKAGDKMVLVTWNDDKGTCCISLMKSDRILDMVKTSLAPMAAEMANGISGK